ncbi:MAG: amidohydrolase family protein [Bacteroidales bacterium]|nr:amidohydrolase family protein [Bacteroidales bacterium]MBQ9722726.1 amidohydrolase family protein [Bacteroidales bacterium]
MKTYLLHKATIVTAAKEAAGSVIISGGKIADVFYTDDEAYEYRIKAASERYPDMETVDLEGKYLMAGGIDAHVHFRDPGLTHKADMYTESRAAVAGGVTTAFDMPNTRPATVSEEAFAAKMELAKEKSCMNLGFHFGATNTNIEEIERILDGKTPLSPDEIKGIKVFMGSSTGNMLVDENSTLDRLFSIKSKPVLVHCEDEETIRQNLQAAIERYGEDIPFSEHENIRSRKACIKSSIKALEKAIRHGTRLVLCHISTKEEIEMVRAAKSNNPDIIAETSCNYLWFCNEDYDRMGSRLKCNPAVKTSADREALREGLANGLIDTIGSDHAPHLPAEKEGTYTKAPSGLPSIQQSLPVLLTIAREEDIPLTRIAAVFSENASDLYRLRRGKVMPGYEADLVIFDKEKSFTVRNEDQYSKCGWSPYNGETLYGAIETVFIGGNIIYKDGKFI